MEVIKNILAALWFIIKAIVIFGGLHLLIKAMLPGLKDLIFTSIDIYKKKK